jgi:phosphatidylglycerophosphate synthase
MFDTNLRHWIDPPLNALGRRIASLGITADQVTLAGFALGLIAAGAIALDAPLIGLAFIAFNRILDGLDGAVARATAPTDRGGFLDIALDFAFYAAIPLAFAIHNPASNALPAAALLAAFLANGAAFLAFAAIAGKRGMTTASQGQKSLYYMAGLAEGGETIATFCLFCLWPMAFPWLAMAFAAVCAVSAASRIILGWKAFG